MIIDCHNHIGVEMGTYLRGDFPYAQSLPALVTEGRAAGVTHWVVFPMVTNLSLNLKALRQGRLTTNGGALEAVPYAFENRRLMEEVYAFFPQFADAVYPFVLLDPMRSVAAQSDALRILHSEYRFYGLKLQTTMIQAPVKSLLSGGSVFLELAQEWDLPVLIHSSVFKKDIWAQAGDILDIAEAMPAVRFCVAHSCRFDRVHLDRLAALPNCWFDCSAHRIHCQLACMDSLHVAAPPRRFPSDYTRPERVLRDLAEAYPGKMLWGTDSPYYSFAVRGGRGLSLFSTYAEEAACLHALPPSLRDEVSRRNTVRCFGLPLAREGEE